MVWEEHVIKGRIGGGCGKFRRYEVSAGVSRPHLFTEFNWVGMHSYAFNPTFTISLVCPALKPHEPIFLYMYIYIDRCHYSTLHMTSLHKSYAELHLKIDKKVFLLVNDVIHLELSGKWAIDPQKAILGHFFKQVLSNKLSTVTLLH